MGDPSVAILHFEVRRREVAQRLSQALTVVLGHPFVSPRATLTVQATGEGGTKTFQVRSRIDAPEEFSYFRNGGILPCVLRNPAR